MCQPLALHSSALVHFDEYCDAAVPRTCPLIMKSLGGMTTVVSSTRTHNEDSETLDETMESLETGSNSPVPLRRPRSFSQFKSDRRHPNSPTPSPRRKPLLPKSTMDRSRFVCLFKQGWEANGSVLPHRAQEIIDRIGNLSFEMKRLEKELKHFEGVDNGEEMEESRVAYPRHLNCQIDFPENPDTAETQRIQWTPSRPQKAKC